MTKLIATGSQTVGPFFQVGLTVNTRLGCLVSEASAGERITLRIRVFDGAGEPVPDAMIEIYQADADGRYPAAPLPGGPVPAFCGWGRLGTDAEGWAAFETIRPGAVPDDEGGMQAAHVNVCLFARGILRHLYTRIYFAGDPALATDSVLSVVPVERRHTLLAQPAQDDPSAWEIAIRMQGGEETVFFDL